MNRHNQRWRRWRAQPRAMWSALTMITGLSVGSLSLLGLGHADYWDGWDENESNVAPMIESYQSLRERSQDAFDEMEEELGERPRRRPQREIQRARQERHVKRTQREVKRVKRIKQVKRVQRTQRVRHSSGQELDRPKPRRVPVARRVLAPQRSASEFESRVLELVNEERAQGGDCGGRSFRPSHPLRGQSELDRAAKRHALAMAEEHFFDHRGPRGDTPKSRIDDSGYQGRAWGENIAAGQRSPESVVRAWMKSPGHCRNILNPLFTELGVSFVFESRSPYKTYWVQAFGTPLNPR